MSNIVNAANAINKLFEHCTDSLSLAELDWLDNLANNAQLEAENIAETLNLLAALLASDNKDIMPTNDSLASVLWGLAYRSETIAALINVSQEAAYLAAKQRSGGVQ